MKITAIRGRGLASLFDPFEVLLDDGPLAQSGLYCICGQTGAGKSTILDAMCLALFGETPRLTGRSKSKIGRFSPGEDDLRLSDRDPRALLSRGCGEGFAEVEFVGVDQEKYRARWSVRRSRRSSSGRLQKAVVELMRVADNKVLSDHPTTRTLGEISNKLGLSFDQFCRSVLLAQGDFSAFLRADDKERADLLERMTGTEVYRKLSKACHLRNREAQSLAQSAKDAVTALQVWDDETLQAKQAQKVQAQTMVDRAQAKLAAQRVLKEALERRASLQHRLQAASREHEMATRAWEEARLDRERLALFVEVHKLRPLHRQLRTMKSKSTGLEEVLKKTGQAFEHATQGAQKAKQTLQDAKGKLEKHQAEHQANAPSLKSAQALDLQLHQLSQTQLEQGKNLQVLEQALEKAEVARAKHTATMQGLDAKLLEIDKAWPEYARSVELFARREEMCGVFEELLSLQKEHQEKQSAIEHRQKERDSLQSQKIQTQEKMQRIERSLADHARTLPEREVQDSGRIQQLDQVRAGCQRALVLAKELLGGQERREVLEERQQILSARILELGTQIAKDAEALERGKNKCAELEVRRDEARLLRDQAHAQEVMLQHRDLLRDGSPCPLCGATEHSRTQKDLNARPGAFALATKRLEDLELEQKALHEAQRELEKRGGVQRSQLEASKREQIEAKAERDAIVLRAQEGQKRFKSEIEAEWLLKDDRLIQTLGELRGAKFGSDVQGATNRVGRMEALTKQVDNAVAELNKALARAAKHRAELDQLRSGQEKLLDVERNLAPKIASNGAELARLTSEDKALIDQSKALRSRLSAMWKDRVGPWTTRIDSLAQLHQRVLAWFESLREISEQRTHLELVRQKVQAELLVQGQGCELQHTRIQDLRALLNVSNAQSAQARAERATLLGGQATELFLQAFERQSKALASAIADAQDDYEVQTKSATEQLARRDGLREQLAELKQELTQTQECFDSAIESLDLPNDKVQEALEVPESRIESLRKAQRQLELAVAESKTLVKSRSEDLRADEQAYAVLPEPDEIQRDLASARQAYEQNQKELVEIEHEIAQNEARSIDRKGLAKAHEHQLDQAKQWAQLNALIGHSEGLSFQKFAQGLSLDRLLLLANQHLQDIDRRYRLSRVHGDSLDLQVVDTMMGDEIRSIHSLSGGESFLISLALALGLSSLSAMHTKVESLFIDEGFGTLDRESLEQVLAALDALQASGRQVGLISHVEGMAEQLGASVEVRPQGHGKSKIVVQGATR